MKITKVIAFLTLAMALMASIAYAASENLKISGDIVSGDKHSGEDIDYSYIVTADTSMYGASTVSYTVKKDVDFPDLIVEVTIPTTLKVTRIINPNRREILMAARVGFIEGYEDGTFKPDNPITRAEFIKMLMSLSTNRTFNILSIPTTYKNWAGRYVTLAEMQGVINKGRYTDAELDKPITRLEVVCMLAKVQIKMKGIEQNQLGHLIFKDIDGLTTEERELLLHAASYDLLEGMKDGTMKKFEPTKNITRGETARALVRIY